MLAAAPPQTPPGVRTEAVAVSTEPVFTAWDYPIFALLTMLNLAAVAYLLIRWFSWGDLATHPLLFILMTFGLLLTLGMYQLHWLSLPLMRRPHPMPPTAGWKVGVATTFVPGAESLVMLEETVSALVAMDYPHDTWVLDEGDDEVVKRMCARLGVHHFSRKHMSQYQTSSGTFEARTKHGNYNAWLYERGFAQYDIIAAFDPDHVPQRDFLLNVLGYFDDARIGYVQAAQVYYNQAASFIARGAAEETYAYYSAIQMTSYAMGYPIVTGCHNTHRVSALKQVGGFAAHEADDLLITVHYRRCGWKGVYVPKILAKGLTPVDWASYLGQQRRWARSVVDIKFRVYPKVATQLPPLERVIGFVHGLCYLQSLATALQVLLLAVMLVTGITPHVLSFATVPSVLILLVVWQLCDFYRQRFYLEPRHEWGLHWRAGVLRCAKWPYLLLALYDNLRPRRRPYIITPKVKAASKSPPLSLPHLVVVGVISMAWLAGTLLGRVTNPIVPVAGAMMVLCSLGVIATGYLRFPAPYDPSLSEARTHQARD